MFEKEINDVYATFVYKVNKGSESNNIENVVYTGYISKFCKVKERY